MVLKKAKRKGPKKPKPKLKLRFDELYNPLPRKTSERAIYKDLAEIPEGIDRIRRKVLALDDLIQAQADTITMKDAEIERRGQSLIEYADHTDKCEWIEEIGSGRLLERKEKDLCTCGWMELKDQLIP